MADADDNRIRVIYIVPPSAHFAGMERVVHEVASGLAMHYHDRLDITVLYCSRYPELDHRTLPYRAVWADAPQLRDFPLRMARWLRRKSCDIVVGAQFEPTALAWLVHRLRGGRARFVMHLHGNPRIEGSGSRRARLAFLLFEPLAARMQRVLAVSPSLARYLEQRLGAQAPVNYLPNPVRQFPGVMRSRPTPGPAARRASAPVAFVAVGRLAWQKGHDLLVQALAQVVAQGIDAHLTIVGAGPEQAALLALIDTLGLAARITLTGHVADPSPQLAEADCFVSASRWEGFGLAIVEALSAGLYVIATDCEFGPADLIDSPAKGRIVANEDIAALAGAMIDFARAGRRDEDDSLRRTAAMRFSIDNVVAQHAAMLDAVAREMPAAPLRAPGRAAAPSPLPIGHDASA